MSHPATLHEEDTLGKAYDRRLVRRLLKYIRPYRALVAGALILLGFAGLLELVGPILTQRVIDVALPRHDTTIVITSVFLYIGALIAQFVCSYWQTWLTSLLGQRVMRDLRGEFPGDPQRGLVTFDEPFTNLLCQGMVLNDIFVRKSERGATDAHPLILFGPNAAQRVAVVLQLDRPRRRQRRNEGARRRPRSSLRRGRACEVRALGRRTCPGR